jgi:hypothetical protein
MVEDLRVPATELGIDLTGVKAIDSRGDLYVTHGMADMSLSYCFIGIFSNGKNPPYRFPNNSDESGWSP